MTSRLANRIRNKLNGQDEPREIAAAYQATSQDLRNKASQILNKAREARDSGPRQDQRELLNRIQERDVLRTASIPGFAPPLQSLLGAVPGGGVNPNQPTPGTPLSPEEIKVLQKKGVINRGDSVSQSGRLNPVPGASLGNSFGAPRSGGRTHEGIDIFGERGSPVIAPVGGVVRKIGDGGLGGHSVSITDDQGNNLYFAHLDRPTHLQPGQRVNPGDLVGVVGDSGNAKGTPPHLHFSVNEGRSTVINAYTWLTGSR